MSSASPEQVVQAQLDAYNARDLQSWLGTYAEDASQYELPGRLLACGHAAMGERIAVRFCDPRLQARLISRTVVGHTVVDHEEVHREYPRGFGRAELLAIYEVRDGLIRSASFAFGEPKYD
ncbi:nuclear transport factor 2 family protein [Pelomonas sp. SE-A7]|uniref:nuclear transport factor 2 family protein n=1 Tax=Pelomonas sp. SE-A7 TaxID=3054953 RepID=UPI00259C9B8E|nr:nuclear transport factor 2 family protein [Pelomonas sp. SE-A7]MDM4764593.1 nuclear transport factor 2 family protein [Pelomonas sp. SE-A7]